MAEETYRENAEKNANSMMSILSTNGYKMTATVTLHMWGGILLFIATGLDKLDKIISLLEVDKNG